VQLAYTDVWVTVYSRRGRLVDCSRLVDCLCDLFELPVQSRVVASYLEPQRSDCSKTSCDSPGYSPNEQSAVLWSHGLRADCLYDQNKASGGNVSSVDRHLERFNR
jgi:hypothetical protein